MSPVVDGLEEKRRVESFPQGSSVVIGESHDDGVDRSVVNGLAQFLWRHSSVLISLGDLSLRQTVHSRIHRRMVAGNPVTGFVFDQFGFGAGADISRVRAACPETTA